MEALKMIPYIFLILAISGVIAGAGILSLGKMGDSMDQCINTSLNYNSTDQSCWNTTAATNITTTAEWNATKNAQLGLSEVAGQFPTIGIIAIMVVIISLISGVFVYMQYFK